MIKHKYYFLFFFWSLIKWMNYYLSILYEKVNQLKSAIQSNSLIRFGPFTNKFFMAFSLWTSKVIKLAKVILITLVCFSLTKSTKSKILSLYVLIYSSRFLSKYVNNHRMIFPYIDALLWTFALLISLRFLPWIVTFSTKSYFFSNLEWIAVINIPSFKVIETIG